MRDISRDNEQENGNYCNYIGLKLGYSFQNSKTQSKTVCVRMQTTAPSIWMLTRCH